MNEILIPISPGELLDKITILQIKSERISDATKVANVRTELGMLEQVWSDTVEDDEQIRNLVVTVLDFSELQRVVIDCQETLGR